jgi:hypothetical protein
MDPKFHRWLIDAQDFWNIGDDGIETHISENDAKSVCGDQNHGCPMQGMNRHTNRR